MTCLMMIHPFISLMTLILTLFSFDCFWWGECIQVTKYPTAGAENNAKLCRPAWSLAEIGVSPSVSCWVNERELVSCSNTWKSGNQSAHFSDISASSGGAVPSVPVKSPSSPGFCSRSSSVLRDLTCGGGGSQFPLKLPQLRKANPVQCGPHVQKDESPSPAVINSMEWSYIPQQ